MLLRIWLLAMIVAAGAIATSGDAHGKEQSRLAALLQRELGLTHGLVEVERGLAALERSKESLRYASSVLEHGGKESLRRLRAYHVARDTRERQTRRRGRSLYKLARGGVLRIMFEDPEGGQGATARRIARGRTLRWLVRHDLQELNLHHRAEARARAELLAAARELQALGGLHMMEGMQRQALDLAARKLDPQVRQAHRARRRAAPEGAPGPPQRRLLRLIAMERRSLRGRGLDLLEARSLVRPVRGRIVGRFGTHEDPILRVPIVRNGVELAAGRNARVRATAGGKVAFVGELPGFDRVVVLDHGVGYLTLTGRLLVVEVAEGALVAPGDFLGRVAPKALDDGLGRTVYFELRHGERPIDPTPYLR